MNAAEVMVSSIFTHTDVEQLLFRKSKAVKYYYWYIYSEYSDIFTCSES